MNVFIIGTPLETAMVLDKKRLNKQIIECQQILDAYLVGSKAWVNHPCTLQYKDFKVWLMLYQFTLIRFKEGNMTYARYYSHMADKSRPSFHTEAYFDSMKRRLYTKDQKHYAQWEKLGTSEVNWYWSPIEKSFIYYRNGKRVTESI